MTDPVHDRPAPALMALSVVNNNDFTIEDMFDGVPVKFPPGVAVDCSEAVCAHLFGYPGELADRAVHMARRFGWSGKRYLMPEGPADDVPLYHKMAEKIVITPIYYDLVRRDPNAPIPVDLGEEKSDRVAPTAEADTSTKLVTRRRTKGRGRRDRHAVDERSGGRVGSR